MSGTGIPETGEPAVTLVIVEPQGPLSRYVVVDNATSQRVSVIEWEHQPSAWPHIDTHLVAEAEWTDPPIPLAQIAPLEATNAQIRVALSHMPGSTAGRSLLDDVNAWVASENGSASIGWEYANTLRRDGAWVQAAAARLGWTDDQLAALFIAAAGVNL